MPLGLVVCESEPGVWCIHETRFVGQEPEARARDYYNAIRRRAVNNRITTILNRAHEISSAALIGGPRLRERRCTAAVLQHKYHDESNWRLRIGVLHLA